MFLSFAEWKSWAKTYPWSVRWVIYLVLLRPIIDNFYFLKDISPFLSPLFIVGVLTPLLTIGAYTSVRHKLNQPVDYLFRIWMFITIFATYFIVYYDIGLIDFFYSLLKILLPFYLYFLFRLFIKSKKDLYGLFQTFVYSSYFVLILFLYELIFNPIAVHYSRGLKRIQGSFGDVTSYAFILIFMLIIVTYNRLRTVQNRPSIKANLPIIIVIITGIFVLLNINHAATMINFAVILLIFILFSTRANPNAAFLIIIVTGTFMVIYGQDIYQANIEPLFAKDIAVFEGEEQSKYLMHGRFGRWQEFITSFSEAPVISQLFGVSLGFIHPTWYVLATTGSGVHNDYFRIMASSGYAGFLIYLFVLGAFIRRFSWLPIAERYLATASLTVLLLYSITITPTFYPSFLYIFLGVYIYVITYKRNTLPNIYPSTTPPKQNF